MGEVILGIDCHYCSHAWCTRLQLRILGRAMRMLQKGGRIVYSTCSMNPVENEAVIAAALKSIPGKSARESANGHMAHRMYWWIGFELVDMSNHLPELVYRPGLTTWTPAVDRAVDMKFATHHDYIQSLPEYKRADSKLVESQWPPTPAEAEGLRLNLW